MGIENTDIEKVIRFKPKMGSNKVPPIRIEFLKHMSDRCLNNEDILKAAKK